ncbi:MAG TPA: hypothetical protein VFL51_13195, partial [Pseudolabrys sp.]|nr:hypothetical protein [Pseudolabrys sp.]
RVSLDALAPKGVKRRCGAARRSIPSAWPGEKRKTGPPRAGQTTGAIAFACFHPALTDEEKCRQMFRQARKPFHRHPEVGARSAALEG